MLDQLIQLNQSFLPRSFFSLFAHKGGLYKLIPNFLDTKVKFPYTFAKVINIH